MTKLCLNMIVRNESARIERCLTSAADHIHCFSIFDTGSTDGTRALINQFFLDYNARTGRDIRGMVHTGHFDNFSQARNDALVCATLDVAALPGMEADYLLLMDADMELVVTDPTAFDNIFGASYDMMQKGGALIYGNRRLLKIGVGGRYVGATHEYLDVAAAGMVSGAHFIDYADGSNRVDKFKRDIALLKADIKKDPNNARSWFYLGQSYRDAGQPEKAAKAYKRRVELGGWDEEVWNAQLCYAHCLKDLGRESEFILNMLAAYNLRPTRAETLYDLAKHFREKPDQQHVSTVFSQAGMKLPLPNDLLFVNSYVYTTGCREEFAITAFYNPATQPAGFNVCNDLTLDAGVPDYARAAARRSLFYYMKPLSAWVPSFEAKRIEFPALDGYTLMNPSIAVIKKDLRMIVRAVNYTIDNEGRYLIKGDAGVNDFNPIDTKNYYVALDEALDPWRVELIDAPLPEPKYNMVRGYEDMRLFEHINQPHIIANVRELNAPGHCEQVRAPLNRLDGQPRLGEFTRMRPDRPVNEKNWMPIDGDSFVYRIGTIVDFEGEECDLALGGGLATDNLSGGSQFIPFVSGYLALVHEAMLHPDGTYAKRYYQHRFVWLDNTKLVRKVSKPFFFHDRQIEFAAGLCWHPDGKHLVMSYGVRDEEAYVAKVSAIDVQEFVFHG